MGGKHFANTSNRRRRVAYTLFAFRVRNVNILAYLCGVVGETSGYYRKSDRFLVFENRQITKLRRMNLSA